MPGTGGPEDTPRDDRDMLIVQEFLGKLEIAHAGALHRGEGVKCALRNVAGKADLV